MNFKKFVCNTILKMLNLINLIIDLRVIEENLNTTIIFAKREEIFEFCFKSYSEPTNLKDGEVRKPCTPIKAIYKFKKPMKS